MLQQKLLPAAPSHHLTQHTLRGTQWQDAAAGVHITDAGTGYSQQNWHSYKRETFTGSTMHGGELPGKEPGAAQEVELKSGRGSGHRGWAIPMVSARLRVLQFFLSWASPFKSCYHAPKIAVSTLTAAPTYSHSIIMLEKRNKLCSLPSALYPFLSQPSQCINRAGH